MWITTTKHAEKSYPKNIWYIIASIFLLFYLVIKAIDGGNDINVYIHASRQLLYQSNIYTLNPFNSYLYSPLFAVLLSPLAPLRLDVARVIWILLNAIWILRLWNIQKELVNGVLPLTTKYKKIWSISVFILSFGFLNHNFNLGQVTILILWLTIEGLYQVRKNEKIKGAILLALGINFKIIPMLALVYLFFKGQIKTITFTTLLLLFTLLLPSFFIGFEYNKKLLLTWKNIINPSGEKYVFENNDGCNSLNALLPAFLFDFKEPSNIEKEPGWTLKRQIASVPESTLILILQASRVLLLLLLPFIVFYRRKDRQGVYGYLYFFWEISYLMLITLLIFPHQMKYSMLCFVPVGAYVIYYYLYIINYKIKTHLPLQITGIISALLLLTLSVMGRDIIGHYLVNILDFYHFMGINNLLFLFILAICTPQRMIALTRSNQSSDVIL